MLIQNQALFAQVYTLTLFYWFVYILTLILLFYCFYPLYSKRLFSLFSTSVFYFNSRFQKILIITLVAMAGLPPFLPFWTKTAVIFFICKNSNFLTALLIIVLAFMSLFFYLNILRYTFPTSTDTMFTTLGACNITISVIIIIFIIVFGFFFVADLWLLCFVFFI